MSTGVGKKWEKGTYYIYMSLFMVKGGATKKGGGCLHANGGRGDSGLTLFACLTFEVNGEGAKMTQSIGTLLVLSSEMSYHVCSLHAKHLKQMRSKLK